MLEPIIHNLSKQTIVLASKSPRRKEILEIAKIYPKIIPSDFDENLNPDNFKTEEEYVEELAARKVEDVCSRIFHNNSFECADLVIGADTIVVCEDSIMGKPKDKAQAVKHLEKLNNKTHKVHTGVCIMSRTNKIRFVETTEVTFGLLDADIIKAYVDTGDPMDKAGGYGIQGLGGSLISGIRGDFYNVMGLPLHRVCCAIMEIYANRK